MMDRAEFMKQIDWQKPLRTKSKADVSIGLSKRENCLNIYLRNGVKEFFGEYVKMGIYKNRIIFEPAVGKNEGFKITRPTKGTINKDTADAYGHFMAYLSKDKYEIFKEWVGDYELRNDDFYDYHYIQQKE